jgi:hypothetical protein
MTRDTPRYFLWIALAVLFGVFPAACGGSDTGEGGAMEDAAADAMTPS